MGLDILGLDILRMTLDNKRFEISLHEKPRVNLCSPTPSCLNLPEDSGLAGTRGCVGISPLSYMLLHFYELRFNLIEVTRLKKSCSALFDELF